MILTNHLPASHNLLISQVVYNGLSDTDKELIMAVGKAAIQYSREQCDARLSERMDLVAQTGTEIVELPADVLEQLRDKCSGVYDEVRATYGDELVDMALGRPGGLRAVDSNHGTAGGRGLPLACRA